MIAITSELYLLNEDYQISWGMSLILYPQREAIHSRPTSELVIQIVGACLCSQMSTEEWILHITEQQKYEQQRGAAAEAANNLFHPLTYSHEIGIKTVSGIHDRRAVEIQIGEFGQVTTLRQPSSPMHSI